MDKILQNYIKETSAIGAHEVCEDALLGTVYEIEYGQKDGAGVILPTGLPVLVYIRDGRVTLIPEAEAFLLLSSLGDEE